MNTDLTFITNEERSNLLERFKVLMRILGSWEMKEKNKNKYRDTVKRRI